MILPIALVIILSLQGVGLANLQPTPQDQSSGGRRQSLSGSGDNSLRIARIVKGEIWTAIPPATGLPGILRRGLADGMTRDYTLAVFPTLASSSSRWQVNGDYFYAVAQFPGYNDFGYILVRIPLKELKDYPSAEELKRSKGFISSPPIEFLSLAPLDPETIAPDLMAKGRATMTKRPDNIRHDFFVGENENIYLVIVAEGKLNLWEIDSRNRWTSLSADERKDASREWKHVAAASVAISDSFILEANKGVLSLVTETGEVWQSDDRATFRKVNAAVTDKADGSSLLIEDTDKRQIWLSRTSENDAVVGERLHLIKGTDGTPSDRIRTAARKLAERNR